MTGRARTLKDLADRLEISVATVSRALNGHQNVAEEVRKRVVSVANTNEIDPRFRNVVRFRQTSFVEGYRRFRKFRI